MANINVDSFNFNFLRQGSGHTYPGWSNLFDQHHGPCFYEMFARGKRNAGLKMRKLINQLGALGISPAKLVK